MILPLDPSPASAGSLTPAQLDDFRRDGFLHMPGFIAPAEIEDLGRRLRSLFDRFYDLPAEHARDLDETPRKRGTPPRNPEITRCGELDPALAASPYVERVRAAAGRLLGGPAELGFDHAIYKPPAVGTGTAWHQDGAYDPSPGLFRRLSFWLPLQPVSAEQGCLQFLPGSHRAGLHPHHPVTGDATGHTLTLDVPADAEPAAVPMALGDLVVHHPYCTHCAGPNTTARPRLAWVLMFQTRHRQPPRSRFRRLAGKLIGN
ncbi:MAG: phytanoyl-CoA dioxygenase family protein [Planctomycetota bacterium]